MGQDAFLVSAAGPEIESKADELVRRLRTNEVVKGGSAHVLILVGKSCREAVEVEPIGRQPGREHPSVHRVGLIECGDDPTRPLWVRQEQRPHEPGCEARQRLIGVRQRPARNVQGDVGVFRGKHLKKQIWRRIGLGRGI
jgi:hypothetical protein